MRLAELLDRPIAYHRVFVNLGAGIPGAVVLSQAIYWSARSSTKDGWFYKTQADWEDETGVTRYELERVRRVLSGIGVLEEKRKGIPAKMFFRVNEQKLYESLLGYFKPLSMEEIISSCAAVFKSISRAGYMRAVKAGVHAEMVDYQEVFVASKGLCDLCGTQLACGPGQLPNDMQFDHIEEIQDNGPHVFSNIRAVHQGCHAQKTAQRQFAVPQQTSLLPESEQVCYAKAGRRATPKQSNTENTAETTAEIKQTPKAGYPDDFESAWRAYPDRPGGSKKDSFKAWAARVKEGATPEALQAGVERYARYCMAMRTEPQYIKQPQTFFGPGEHYKLAWDIPLAGGRKDKFDPVAYLKSSGGKAHETDREKQGDSINGEFERVD